MLEESGSQVLYCISNTADKSSSTNTDDVESWPLGYHIKIERVLSWLNIQLKIQIEMVRWYFDKLYKGSVAKGLLSPKLYTHTKRIIETGQ